MKTLKLTLISLLVAGASSAVFAGPGLEYWQKKAAAANPASAKAVPTAPTTSCASGCCTCSGHK